MPQFTASRNGHGNLTLKVDDVRYGTIFLRDDGSITGGCFNDREISETFRRLNMPIHTIDQALARARKAYEIVASED